MELSRRDLLKLGLLSSAALYLPVERLARAADFKSLTKLPTPYSYPFAKPPSIDLRAAANGGTPVTRLEMSMRQVDVGLLGPAGRWPQTPVWA
jgi:hypothetical protein